jgi:hypothetical protein
MDNAPGLLAESPPVLAVVAAPQKDAQSDIKPSACRRFVQDKIQLCSGQDTAAAATYLIARRCRG